MGKMVIVGYSPKEGKSDALHELLKTHVPRLRAEGLVTSRAPILMRAADGTFIEVFEWKSQEAIDSAHSNAAVGKMWAEYSEVCDYVPVGTVSEIHELFSAFEPVEAE